MDEGAFNCTKDVDSPFDCEVHDILLVALFVELEKAVLAEGESQVEESEASKESTGRMVDGILSIPDEFVVRIWAAERSFKLESRKE